MKYFFKLIFNKPKKLKHLGLKYNHNNEKIISEIIYNDDLNSASSFLHHNLFYYEFWITHSSSIFTFYQNPRCTLFTIGLFDLINNFLRTENYRNVH